MLARPRPSIESSRICGNQLQWKVSMSHPNAQHQNLGVKFMWLVSNEYGGDLAILNILMAVTDGQVVKARSLVVLKRQIG